MNGDYGECFMSRTVIGLVAGAFLALSCLSALAAEPVGYGPRSLAQCREATNGCEICVYDASGAPRCSLPGIACQPSSWRCIKAETPPADSTPAVRPEQR